MRHLATLLLVPVLLLLSCEDSSTGGSSGGQVDPALVGKWARRNGTSFTDTLIFSGNGYYYVPFCSGTGGGLKATGGQVWCPASQETCGEYQLSGDTLFYEGLLGSVPDGVVERTGNNTYLRVR